MPRKRPLNLEPKKEGLSRRRTSRRGRHPPAVAGKEPVTEPGKEAAKGVAATPEPGTEPTPAKPDLPSGTLGKAEKPAGILLRYDPERREVGPALGRVPAQG